MLSPSFSRRLVEIFLLDSHLVFLALVLCVWKQCMAQAFWHIMGWALIVLSACGTADSHLISKRRQQKVPE